MSVTAPDQVRTVPVALRWLLAPFVVLAGLAFAALYLSTEHTDRVFAWTIEPPLSAAFLGAAYGGAFVMFVLGLRERVWANARIAVLPPLLLSSLTLAATLLHLDRFHLAAPGAVARTVAWIWLLVYLVVPVALAVLLWRQWAAAGGDPPRASSLPGAARGVLAAQGGLMLGVGAGLFLSPVGFGAVWPWPLTPLTGRAVGAWLIGLAGAALLAVWERDPRRVRAGVVGLVAIAVLQIGALLRYGAEIRWHAPGAWIYLGMVVGLLLIGGYGWRAGRR